MDVKNSNRRKFFGNAHVDLKDVAVNLLVSHPKKYFIDGQYKGSKEEYTHILLVYGRGQLKSRFTIVHCLYLLLRNYCKLQL